nr:hypothetical protein [Methylocystis echinoides]
MDFGLAGVVRNVKHQRQFGMEKENRENLPDQMANDFAVGEGAIDRRAHRAKIALTWVRRDGRAGSSRSGGETPRLPAEIAISRRNSVPI